MSIDICTYLESKTQEHEENLSLIKDIIGTMERAKNQLEGEQSKQTAIESDVVTTRVPNGIIENLNDIDSDIQVNLNILNSLVSGMFNL